MIVVVPALIPVIVPDVDPIVATVGLELDQVLPDELESVSVLPTQI